MEADDIAKILGALGLGSTAGAVVTAMLNSYTSKGKSRAEAADLLVSAAERVAKLNASLDKELGEVKARMDHIQLCIIQYLAEEMTREQLLIEMKGFRQ